MRLGIGEKTSALIILLVLFSAGLTSYFTITRSHDELIKRELESQGNEARLIGFEVQSDIGSIQHDAFFLAKTPPIQGFIRARANGGLDPQSNDTDEVWLNRLAIIFEQIMENKPQYLTIRYIGIADEGRELLRMDRSDNDINQTAEAELKSIGHTIYFQQTIDLEPDKIYLSKIELLRENNVTQIPHVLVLRVAVPIYTISEDIFGLVIIDMDYDLELRTIASLLSQNKQLIITNDDGDFLHHHINDKHIGPNLNQEKQIQIDYPELAKMFVANNTIEEMSLLSKDTGTKYELFFQKIHFDSENPQRFLGIAILTSSEDLIAGSIQIRNTSIVISLFIIAFALLLGWFFSGEITRPLKKLGQATEAIAQGNYELELPTSSKDELGQLSQNFHFMAQQVLSRENQLTILASALEAADNSIMITDELGRIEWVNPAFTKLTGYSVEELIGRDPRILNSGKHDKAFYKNLWNTILSGQVWEAEIIIKRKDGSYFFEEQVITPVKDKNNQITHFISIMRDVSERKKAEEELTFLASFPELNPIPIIEIDHHNIITYSNQAAREQFPDLTEKGPDHSIIRDLRSIIPEFASNKKDFDYLVVNYDDKIYEQYITYITEKKRIRIYLIDITKRKQAEEQTAIFRRFAESAGQGFGMADLQGTITYVNPTLCEIIGETSHDDIIGRSFIPFYSEEFHEKLKNEIIPQVLQKGLWTGELALMSKEGRTIPTQENIFLIKDAEGKPQFIADIISDVSERKRAEKTIMAERASLTKRVRERTSELSLVNAELARSARLKDEFLASMSHELRTPLNAILGISEALQEEVYGQLNSKQLNSLHSVEESGRHLLELINDILDVAKIEAGKLELELHATPVKDICEASLRLLKQGAHSKQLDVTFKMDEQVTTIIADARRLKQMLVNLLSNAVKFTPEGGRIGLEVRSDVESGTVHFSVWDTGLGISEEDLERLFKPFVQLDSRLSREHAGTGLGLALVYRMSELHGGSVSVESTKGVGSRFTICLPWHTRERSGLEHADVEAEAIDVKGGPRVGDAGEPPLVLLAEDNEMNIVTIKDYLEVKGYRVIVARNGLQAIELAQKENPKVILMDVQMPVMDGLEAIKKIRADVEPSDIPIIALTALAMIGDRERCLKAGADHYMSKPVRFKELVKLMESQIDKKQEVGEKQ